MGRSSSQLEHAGLASIESGEVVVAGGPTDEEGNLEAAAAGQVVLSVPSPEALRRQAEEVGRVIREAGSGTEPLVVSVGVAEELREEEIAALLKAAGHARRAVILRIERGPEQTDAVPGGSGPPPSISRRSSGLSCRFAAASTGSTCAAERKPTIAPSTAGLVSVQATATAPAVTLWRSATRCRRSTRARFSDSCGSLKRSSLRRQSSGARP